MACAAMFGEVIPQQKGGVGVQGVEITTTFLTATIPKILVFTVLLPLYTTCCRRMIDVFGTIRTVTSAHAVFCLLAQQNAQGYGDGDDNDEDDGDAHYNNNSSKYLGRG